MVFLEEPRVEVCLLRLWAEAELLVVDCRKLLRFAVRTALD